MPLRRRPLLLTGSACGRRPTLRSSHHVAAGAGAAPRETLFGDSLRPVTSSRGHFWGVSRELPRPYAIASVAARAAPPASLAAPWGAGVCPGGNSTGRQNAARQRPRRAATSEILACLHRGTMGTEQQFRGRRGPTAEVIAFLPRGTFTPSPACSPDVPPTFPPLRFRGTFLQFRLFQSLFLVFLWFFWLRKMLILPIFTFLVLVDSS